MIYRAIYIAHRPRAKPGAAYKHRRSKVIHSLSKYIQERKINLPMLLNGLSLQGDFVKVNFTIL